MNVTEYEKIKEMKYFDYCEYLKEKYGRAKDYYMTKSFYKKSSITRTKEGLLCHHIMEYYIPKLSERNVASCYSYEYQSPEKLVYCDYLEHILLHIMISEESNCLGVGIGGLVAFMIPQLNDFYCDFIPKLTWLLNVRNKIINDKDTYLLLLARFFEARYTDTNKEYSFFDYRVHKITPKYVHFKKLRLWIWNKTHKNQIRYMFKDDIFDHICRSSVTIYTKDTAQDIHNADLYTEIFNLALPIIEKNLDEWAEKHNVKDEIEVFKYDFYNRYSD